MMCQHNVNLAHKLKHRLCCSHLFDLGVFRIAAVRLSDMAFCGQSKSFSFSLMTSSADVSHARLMVQSRMTRQRWNCRCPHQHKFVHLYVLQVLSNLPRGLV